MTTKILICLLVWFATTAIAHDPYEITSVAYVHSNRIELFIEMEFPAGMNLAGQKPVQNVTVVSQFGSALPRLRELAGRFYQITAGNNALLPLSTNVEMGVEDHIQFKVTYPATPFRPLHFVATGLGNSPDQTPYGTSLTVLDMVNQKVLGQTTLFAATPSTDIPLETFERKIVASSTSITNSINTTMVSIPQTNYSLMPAIPDEHKSPLNLLILAAVLVGPLLIGAAIYAQKKRST